MSKHAANRSLRLLSDSKSLSELTEQFEPALEQVISFVKCQSHNSYIQYLQNNGSSFYLCFLFQLFTLIEKTNNQQLSIKVIECVKPSLEGLLKLGCMWMMIYIYLCTCKVIKY